MRISTFRKARCVPTSSVSPRTVGCSCGTYGVAASPERSEHFKQLYTDWRARISEIKFDSLAQDGKVDYVLFRNLLDHELRRLELEAIEARETAPYTAFAPVIVKLEETRRKMDPVSPQQSAKILAGLPKQIEDTRRAVDAMVKADGSTNAARQRKAIALRAAQEVNGLRTTLRVWFTFYDGYDPLFTWWTNEAYRAADASLQNYATYLRERVAGAAGGVTQARAGETDDIVGNPIGRDGLMNELAYEMIPYTPEQLIAIAEKEFAWCEGEMKKASREMGFGDDGKAALEKVKNTYVEPGKQPELIRDLEHEAEKFLDDHDLITIPPLVRESWRMEMMTPERQLVNPFFTGGEVMSVSYPVAAMTFEQKMMSMRGNNPHFSRATVFHELIPGHHLQGFMAARYRPYRSIVGGTPFITEGWSLYWELLLWDLHFQKSPEDRVGALFWRMHRCARIIFSLKFHLGEMTPDEAINFLVDRVGHERENAVGEVRRSFGPGYGPLYQAAYLLGGMQLYALHHELVDVSKKMTNRQFHDAVLRENRIPVEMIRAALTGQSLTAGYRANWKFDAP